MIFLKQNMEESENKTVITSLNSLPTQTKRLFHRVTTDVPKQQLPLNIFQSQKNIYGYEPNERPIGTASVIKRIKQSIIKPDNLDYMHKTQLSTKVDTIIKNNSRIKTLSEFNSVPVPKKTAAVEEVLKKDLYGLSVDHIKPINKRHPITRQRSTLYDKNSKPFLQKMGKRSMSEYKQQLIKKFGNRYFEKTLRNSYQDDPPKAYMVTLFAKQQKQLKPRLRKKATNLPFFKRHQFMEVKGQSKKQKQTKTTPTREYSQSFFD